MPRQAAVSDPNDWLGSGEAPKKAKKTPAKKRAETIKKRAKAASLHMVEQLKLAEPGTKAVTINLPIEMVERLDVLAVKRGSSVQDLVRLSLHNLSRHETILDLESKVGFGKYSTETMNTVIRADPSYVTWMLKTIERVTLSEACLDLIADLDQ
jgi:hypothetical protein